MKRSCQRQTQVFDLPVRRMISLVPTPSALNRTISARQTCLCGALRSRASAFRRRNMLIWRTGFFFIREQLAIAQYGLSGPTEWEPLGQLFGMGGWLAIHI